MPHVFDTEGRLRGEYKWLGPEPTPTPSSSMSVVGLGGGEDGDEGDSDASEHDARDMGLAFSCHLWAYRTGNCDRQRRLVVRIRNDESESDVIDMDALEGDTNMLDDIDAGKSWSASERDIHNAPMSDLAVVIGEFLPVDAMPGRLVKPTALDGWTFNPHKHTIVPRADKSMVVVRRISDRKLTFYLVHDKKGGLCRISQLPRGFDNRIVYYDEWTKTGPISHMTVRKNMWENNILSFCQDFVERRRRCDASNSSIHSDPETSFATGLDRFKSLSLFVMGAWASYRWVSFHVKGGCPKSVKKLRETLDEGLPVLRNSKRRDRYSEYMIET
ncbi:hypothetical protein B0T10DRAFT_52707 [Thelonectria olida]|uniref:Uncharacterized protein n=1 Tax=Thelonectria olida TaxID=1576542 RepID=A0A9P8W4N8_9HYPO|nr:hypothetical protein B0T10DRAFT_52707 [Thelonectria olida]